jgi:hypothetical protein
MKYEYILTVEDKKVFLPNVREMITEEVELVLKLKKEQMEYSSKKHPFPWLQECFVEFMQEGISKEESKLQRLRRVLYELTGSAPGLITSDNFIDYRRIKEDVSMLQVAQDHLEPTKRPHIFRCFLHEDKTPSLTIDIRKNRWKCFSCGEGTSNIDFIMKKLKVGFQEALKILDKY